jgi:hypothetical protein
MKLASSILFAVLVLAGCDNPVVPSSDLISARGSNQTLEIRNDADNPVYYFVAESGTLALLDWAVCVDPTNGACQAVAAHSTAQIPYSNIYGPAAKGSRVVVFHWRLIPTGAANLSLTRFGAW